MRGSALVERVPTELVAILLRFLSPGTLSLITASRSLWLRLRGCRETWESGIARAQRSQSGRALLRRRSTALLAWCPPLRYIVPARVANQAEIFSLSPDGRFVACGLGEELRILDGVTLRQVAVVALEAASRPYVDLCFSPSGALLACAGKLCAASVPLCSSSANPTARTHARARSGIVVYASSQAWAKVSALAVAWTRMAFRPDDSVLFSTKSGRVFAWDARAVDHPRLLASNVNPVFALAAARDAFATGATTSCCPQLS